MQQRQVSFKIFSLLCLLFFCTEASNSKPSRRSKRTNIVSKETSHKFYTKAFSFNSYFLKNADDNFIPNEEERLYLEKYGIISDSFFAKLLPANTFNGGIIVAKHGKIVYERYSGLQDRQKKIAITANTSFHIASVSKTITAMVILKLEEQKKLHIDDLVVKYLPDFPYLDITIRQLLNHRSGLNGYDNFMDNYWRNKKEFPNNMDILTNVSVNAPKTKIFPTDKRFFYSNTNYALLATIIEKITGVDFPTYMQNYVFTPLKMSQTYVFSLEDTAIYTPSYDLKGRKEKVQYLDAIYGDKNVYTTLRDLLRWDLALYNPNLFRQETLKKAFQPYSFERNTLENYGLGWRMKYIARLDRFIPYHYGWWHGNRSMFIRDIENKLTIIILSNQLNKNMYRTLDLIDIFSKIEHS